MTPIRELPRSAMLDVSGVTLCLCPSSDIMLTLLLHFLMLRHTDCFSYSIVSRTVLVLNTHVYHCLTDFIIEARCCSTFP